MLPREPYLPPAGPDRAQWGRVYYLDGQSTREEVLTASGESDAYLDWKRRTSRDNGRTWSEFEPIGDATEQHDDGGIVTYPCGYQYDTNLGILYEKLMRRLWPGLPIYTFHWGGEGHPFNDHTFVVENGGEEELLRYEDGPGYDPRNPFDPEFCTTNCAYVGVGFAFADDGTAYLPLVCKSQVGGMDALHGGVVLMRRDPSSAEWLASKQVHLTPEQSSRGLLEPDVAVLGDGRLLIVARGSDTETTPGRKWFTVSADGGRTLSPVQEFRYEDGSPFYSPSSIHSFVRSSRNGRLYWLANIDESPPRGNSPRYPLVIAEIDESRVAVRRDSIVTVDDRDEGEPEALQLSNFCVLEDRENGDIEIYLTRLGEDPDHFWGAGMYRYVFTPPK